MCFEILGQCSVLCSVFVCVKNKLKIKYIKK